MQHLERLRCNSSSSVDTLVSNSDIALVSAAKKNIRKNAMPTAVPAPMLANILGSVMNVSDGPAFSVAMSPPEKANTAGIIIRPDSSAMPVSNTSTCLVLVTALCGMNVMKVLLLGILSSGLIGMAAGSFTALEWCSGMGRGITGMGELIIITMLAGGVLEMLRHNGGIDYLIGLMTHRIRGRRGAEASIAGLVCVANLCTANNTIAILTVGPIARKIADRFGIDRRRSASLLDTFSCFTQGLLPYGAQLLMAAGLTGLSPLEIIRYLYYPFIMGLCALLAIVLRYPRSVAGAPVAGAPAPKP